MLMCVGLGAMCYAFLYFNLIVGFAIAMVPTAIVILWASIRNPAVAMLGLFIINYFIMSVTRYAPGLPVGTVLDALVLYNILIITLHSLVCKVEWRNARTGLTAVAVIWLIYCMLISFGPDVVSYGGWISSARSIAFYFFFIVVLAQITLNRYKYLKYMLLIWSVLTLIGVGKACIQKFIGFNEAELYWLYVLGGQTTHIIYSGIRYFSFFSDAANFGAIAGHALVVFSIAVLYYRNYWMKIYFLMVSGVALYGMLISGTRSALAVPFAGFAIFVLLSRNAKMIVLGTLAIIGAFIFLNFTTIGQGQALIRRARSAFDFQDKSFQVRLENQAKLRQLMADKPFGIGIGNGGGKALEYAPNSPHSLIPTDSWFVMIWVETGIVGLILHIGILLYILARGSYLVVFKLRNTQLRGLTAALVAGSGGIIVMSYGNEILGQIPTGAILYMSMALIFLSPHFDKELSEEQEPRKIE